MKKALALNNSYEVKVVKKPEIEQIISLSADNFQFGWKKEAIP